MVAQAGGDRAAVLRRRGRLEEVTRPIWSIGAGFRRLPKHIRAGACQVAAAREARRAHCIALQAPVRAPPRGRALN